MSVRRVEKCVLSVEQSEGVGARVRRSIGRQEVSRQISCSSSGCSLQALSHPIICLLLTLFSFHCIHKFPLWSSCRPPALPTLASFISFPPLYKSRPFFNPPIPTYVTHFYTSILHSSAALDGWPQVLKILQLVYFCTSLPQSSTWLLFIHTLVFFVLFLLKSSVIALRVNFHINSSRSYWQSTVHFFYLFFLLLAQKSGSFPDVGWVQSKQASRISRPSSQRIWDGQCLIVTLWFLLYWSLHCFVHMNVMLFSFGRETIIDLLIDFAHLKDLHLLDRKSVV